MSLTDVIDEENYINVTEAVGPYAASNQLDNVMVVQALLKFINMGSKTWPEATVSEPDGTYTPRLATLIVDFQRQSNQASRGTLQYAVDGRVSPAKGKSQYGYRQVWTIIALNDRASMIATALGLGNHIDAICSRWSQVKKVLKK